MLNGKNDVHIVIIEWDSATPPSNYYRRLHTLAFRVRGDGSDADLGPIARRTNDGETETGVIFQEGCVICPSEDLARQVAFMAREYGAKNVLLGNASLTNTFTQTARDTEIIERLTKVMGKRGRKPAPVKWAISCRNCLHVTPYETWSPLNCPACGGMLISARQGEIISYRDPGGDVIEAWQRTRYAKGNWEPTPITDDPDVPAPPADVEIFDKDEAPVLRALLACDTADVIRTMPRDIAFSFLDAIVQARAHHTRESRLANRLAVVQEYFMRDGDPAKISLVETSKPDLVDAGIGLGKDNIVPWLLRQQ